MTGATGAPRPTNLTFPTTMKNDDAPKVTVIPETKYDAAHYIRRTEFSRMGELIPHAAKFRSSNLLPRIVIRFRYQT